jgi:hypothetical protein
VPHHNLNLHQRLSSSIAKLQSAVLARQDGAQGLVDPLTSIPSTQPLVARRAAQERPTTPPSPTVQPTAPAWPTAAEVLGDRRLSRGATLLWDRLHGLALYVAGVRGHAVLPNQLTYHLPAVIVAALAGYSERHLYRLADELRRAGLIDERGHVGQVGKLRRYDGTLWAISLKPAAAAPRLRWWDFKNDWRPDFASDYHGEKGAYHEVQAILSEPFAFQEDQGKVLRLAREWAAALKVKENPVEGGSDMRPGRALQAVARDLPALVHLHPRQRHREVSRLALDLAHALGEPGRFRQHCASIYAAVDAENEQRAGLHALALQLQRLATDLAELAPWRKPGAVLAARLRT